MTYEQDDESMPRRTPGFGVLEKMLLLVCLLDLWITKSVGEQRLQVGAHLFGHGCNLEGR